MNVIEFISINLPEIKPSDIKIHLAVWNGAQNPLDVYLMNQFNDWQQWQTKRNFQRKFVLSLIALPQTNEWLFAGIYRRVGFPVKTPAHWDASKMAWLYNLEEDDRTMEFHGRLVVSFNRPGRQSYLKAESWVNKILFSEVYPSKLDVGEFPGYKQVNIQKPILDLIVNKSTKTWRSALENISGVYLITDGISGKLYVGSATGAGGIWQRWESYSKTGHGGNIELRNLLQSDLGHANGFSFSILEIADNHASSDYIKMRESHWKTILQSRVPRGLNAN